MPDSGNVACNLCREPEVSSCGSVENVQCEITAIICVSFSTAQWKDVCVGDVLRIHKDQLVPVSFSIHKEMQINSSVK